MPIVQVISSKPRAGKSAVAAGLAQGLARGTQRVQLIRAGASQSALLDAVSFAELLVVSAPPGASGAASISASPEHVTVVELDAGVPPLAEPAVLVTRGAPTADDEALGKSLGPRLIGTIATLVPAASIESVARDLTNAGLRPLAVLPEDRRLAAPSVNDMGRALAAEVLYEGDNMRASIDDVVVAPVFTDGAKTHFRRFEGSKAILAPAYKTDLLLAAVQSDAACVIATGGHKPSHYLIDRVQGQATSLLLAPQETPAAVTALSDVWSTSAFAGEEKAAAVLALLSASLDWDSLLKKLI